jgi:ribosome-associated protein
MSEPLSTAPGETERPSKTRRKQAMHALQALGERLVDLPSAQFAAIDLPEDLRAAVAEARHITKHEAKRRQLQYVGRLMREVDAAPIRAQLARFDGESIEATRELHLAERWRDRLIADDAALTEFARAHPEADLQALRATIREVRKERAAARPPKHARELFRAVRTLIQPHGGHDDD